MWLSPGQRIKVLENPLIDNTASHHKRPPCHLCTRHTFWRVTHLSIISVWSPRITFIVFWSCPTLHSATKYSQVTDLHATLPPCSHNSPWGREMDSSAKFFLLNFTYAYCKYDKGLKDKYQEWSNIREYFMCLDDHDRFRTSSVNNLTHSICFYYGDC